MSKKPSKKSHVFEKEYEILARCKDTLAKAKEAHDVEALLTSYQHITQHYEQLLSEARLLTSVSDRLQNKLNKANEKIVVQNQELRETIDLLTKARVGRRAATLVLVLAVALFLVTEALIEPQIEAYFSDRSFLFVLGLKAAIILPLKPLEAVIEKYLLRRASRTTLEGASGQGESR